MPDRRASNPTMALSLPATSPAPESAPLLPPRYEDRGVLGVGGMGEVRRVWDRELHRHVAMKLLRADRVSGAFTDRFVAEARLVAQLDHPGIVSVHDMGLLPDGRAWFTMREVQGRTLANLVDLVHGVSVADWRATADGWSLRRLLSVLEAVCDIVAYAHAHGVVHRDLKPSNIMVGRFGEVQVMDWGLASRDDPMTLGRVVGTPGYMAPEQATAGPGAQAPPVDVFALAATLYEILTGTTPYPSSPQGLAAVRAGHPPPPFPARVPVELARVALTGLAPDPSRRPASPQALALAIRAWLDGLHRREQALAVVADAQRLLPRVEDLRRRARSAREEGARLLRAVPSVAPEEARWPGWEEEDGAARLQLEAEGAEVAYTQALLAALQVDPDAPEPHAHLADHWRDKVVEAEQTGDLGAAARAELLLRAHDRGRHARFLEGDGALSLVTDPPGATVEVYRYVERHRRLTPERVITLAPTPLVAVDLPRGSYLLVIRAPGRAPVRYPVRIGREQHWDGVPPEGGEPAPVWLPEALGDEEIYVPGGWFVGGGDDQATDALPRRDWWVDGFVLDRDPVTWAEYLRFLDDGGADAAPLPAFRVAGEAPHPLVDRVDGRWVLVADPMGRRAEPDEPVRNLTHPAAQAYAAWRAARTGLPWRLPYSLEREKAGRGVDARQWPWGDHFDPSRANVLGSLDGPPRIVPTGRFPADVGPYGARGLAGNLRDWCADGWTREGPPPGRFQPSAPGELLLVRGGSAVQPAYASRLAGRFVARAGDTLANVGFRLARATAPSRSG